MFLDMKIISEYRWDFIVHKNQLPNLVYSIIIYRLLFGFMKINKKYKYYGTLYGYQYDIIYNKISFYVAKLNMKK